MKRWTMRRNEKEIKEQIELYEILSRGQIIRLGMALNNEPYVVPMNYGFKDGELYLHSALEGKKIDMLRKNPIVCFEVSVDTELKTAQSACGWTFCFRSVIGRGKAHILTDEKSKIDGLDIIIRHFGSMDNTYKPEAVAKTCVIKIVIDELTGKMSPIGRD